jgi:hypothetical protein
MLSQELHSQRVDTVGQLDVTVAAALRTAGRWIIASVPTILASWSLRLISSTQRVLNAACISGTPRPFL